MQLKGKQFQQLQQAVLGAFPNRAKLKQMVRFGLEENLDAIATGNHDNVVFELIEWAETNGKLKDLLTAACDGNPGNLQLKRFCEQLGQEQATTKQSHRLLNPCNFDLNTLIEECWEKLDSKHGVVGLAVSSDYDVFVKNFCERLKDELEIKYPYIPSLSLNPITTKPIDPVKKSNNTKKSTVPRCNLSYATSCISWFVASQSSQGSFICLREDFFAFVFAFNPVNNLFPQWLRFSALG